MSIERIDLRAYNAGDNYTREVPGVYSSLGFGYGVSVRNRSALEIASNQNPNFIATTLDRDGLPSQTARQIFNHNPNSIEAAQAIKNAPTLKSSLESYISNIINRAETTHAGAVEITKREVTPKIQQEYSQLSNEKMRAFYEQGSGARGMGATRGAA
ncbi:MAG: hypothetical protein ISQ32_04385 [Rickettsiales bacterium]|nr:hypothetical protein [Rickettsiales bacterium]